MSDKKANKNAEENLLKAFKMHKIDIVTYHNKKDQLENQLKNVYDDGTTCNRG